MTMLSVAKGVTVLALCAAAAANAQGPAAAGPRRSVIELGIDAGATFDVSTPTATMVSIPVQDFRIGFMTSPRLEIEPSFMLQYYHFDGENETNYQAVLGVLYHFSTDRRVNQFYVRPFAGVGGFSGSGSDHTTQPLIGAGLGVKMPLAPRLSARFEANYQHVFSDNDVPSENDIGLRAGLSFFTR
jgi:hypothetical protein